MCVALCASVCVALYTSVCVWLYMQVCESHQSSGSDLETGVCDGPAGGIEHHYLTPAHRHPQLTWNTHTHTHTHISSLRSEHFMRVLNHAVFITGRQAVRTGANINTTDILASGYT